MIRVLRVCTVSRKKFNNMKKKKKLSMLKVNSLHSVGLYKAENHVTYLFYSGFWTEQIKLLLIIFLLLNGFLCGKVQIPCLYLQPKTV